MSMTLSASGDAAVERHDHVVQFYETDDFLARTVAEFMGDGLDAGDPVVVIATEAHRRAFAARLTELGVDVEATVARGRLALLDAHEMLATFMDGSAPDCERFRASIGGVFTAIASRGNHRRVRAFGEMVDVLWREGNRTGALLVEELWNDLGKTHSFSLLCAYVVDKFFKVGASDLHDVCVAHGRIRALERPNPELDAAVRTATLAREHTRALAAELEHRKEVERALREALAEREALVSQLQETARANELFTAILGHDLRNPLNAIVTAAQLGVRHSHDPIRAARCNARILASGYRMARMIDQILDFTRLRLKQGVPIICGPCDVASVLRPVVEELQVANAERSIEVEHAGDTQGSWDVDRLAQVFSNLIGNAVHHGDPKAPVRVHMDGADPERVRVTVWNAGTISPELLGRLFIPFDTEKRRNSPQGLGLGLYISREVVSAHGGRLDVSSDPAGTTFVVTLPRR